MPDLHAPPDPGRRPLKSRTTGWAALATQVLLKTPITPNQISLLGVLFAALGAWALTQTTAGPAGWWLLAALCIQLRLLANMFDGLVAVEGRRGHPTGALYNELPDRLQDVLLLSSAGIAIGAPEVGLINALLAVICAYVRLVGSAIGLPQDFRGPMAKPHRMAALTLGCIIAFAAMQLGYDHIALMGWTLLLIGSGAILTIIRRTVRMHQMLSAKAP